MVVSESGLCKLMGRAYRAGGYRVIPTEEGRRLSVVGSTWAVSIPNETFPRKALGLLATHAGCIPTEALRVAKDQENQMMIPEDGMVLLANLERQGVSRTWAKPLPVNYMGGREELALFQAPGRGMVRAFRVDELILLDVEEAKDLNPLIGADGGLGIWGDGDEVVYLCTWKLQGSELAKVSALGRIDWDRDDDSEGSMTEENSLDNYRLSGFGEDGDDGTDG